VHKLLTVTCYHTRTKQLVTNRLTWCVSQQSLTMLCSHGAPILCTLHTALYVVQAIVTSQRRSCPEVSILIHVMCSKPLLLILGCLQILHRDIKSGNILLSQHFESAKICDVGLAHIMTNTSLSSSTSSSGGQQVQTTLAYAAPELLLCLRSTPLLFIFNILCFCLYFFYLFCKLSTSPSTSSSTCSSSISLTSASNSPSTSTSSLPLLLPLLLPRLLPCVTSSSTFVSASSSSSSVQGSCANGGTYSSVQLVM